MRVHAQKAVGPAGAAHTSGAPAPATPSGRLQNTLDNQATKHLLSGSLARTVQSPNEAPAIAVNALASLGRPLDEPTREHMEKRFGHPFGHVRVHTGTEASAAANALGAEAFTDGRRIVLGEGYTPGSPKGNDLLSHELSHVVATDRTGTVIDPRRITPADHASERQASAASRSHASGLLTAAPVGLALRRKSEETKANDSHERQLQRQSMLLTRQENIMTEVRVRLLEMKPYVEAAVRDFEASATSEVGDSFGLYVNYAITIGTPAIIQLIRINLMATPYPQAPAKGLMGHLQSLIAKPKPIGAAPHSLVTILGVVAAGMALSYVMGANREVEGEKQRVKGLAELTDFENTAALLKSKLEPEVARLFATNGLPLLTTPASDIVDALRIPRATAESIYFPVRFAFEESFANWRLDQKRSSVLPGLFREATKTERFKAKQEARVTAEQGLKAYTEKKSKIDLLTTLGISE